MRVKFMDNNNSEKILQWKNKLDKDFGDSQKLYEYLFETLENFFYRYLETSISKNLKISTLDENVFGAVSIETNMLESLKIKFPDSKKILIDLAKKIPKHQGPQAKFSLKVKVHTLTHDYGKIDIISSVEGLEVFEKKVIFEYNDFQIFRKNLATKLEEACEIFL